jgi:hypothetical protein
MGAINKITNKYEYPGIASKENNYTCPDCAKDVILRKGKIRVHHFAHSKSDNPCSYYNNPGESQIHKDAKMALKVILEQDNNVCFSRCCNNCGTIDKIKIDKKNIGRTIIEHKFNYNNSIKFADVAYLEENVIKYIFEICYKHKTNPTKRPEPWFEIDAVKLLNNINENNSIDITIECIRDKICNNCIEIVKNMIKNDSYNQAKQDHLLQELEGKMAEKRNKDLYIKKELIKEIIMKYKEREKERLRKIEEEKRLKFIKLKSEKSNEIMSKLRSEHKRCTKCKSYERCKKCVDKLWKMHNEILKNELIKEEEKDNNQPE